MNIPYVFKKCTKCGEIKLATTEYFRKKKGCRFGLYSQCKICRQEYNKQYYQDKKEHRQEYNKQYYQDKKEHLKERQKQYYQDNKEHRQEYNKQYYQDNKEHRQEYHKQWHQDNKEHIQEYNKQWYQDNKEHIQEYHKEYNQSEKGKARRKRYEQTEKAHIAKFNRHCRRRAKEATLGNGITVEQWQECMNFFNWKCAYSGKPLKEGNRSLDHITPLNLGGENEIWNLVPMYINYNSSKQDKEMLEWYKEQPFYSEDRLKKIYEWQEYAYNKYNKEVAYCTK